VKWVSGVRGLELRAICAFVLALVAAVGTLPSCQPWGWPIVVILHKPLMATWFFLLPSEDSYVYYVPVGFNLSFLLFLALATTIYLGILYVPTCALEIWRSTWLGLSTPVPFVAYAILGGAVGGMLAFWGWASFSTQASQHAMWQAVIAGGALLGWSSAVVRCTVERRYLRSSL
jgi:hypothetical protein